MIISEKTFIYHIVNNTKGQTYALEKYMKNIDDKILPDSNRVLNSTFDYIQMQNGYKGQSQTFTDNSRLILLHCGGL